MSNSICNKFEQRLGELVESNSDTLSRDLLEHAGSCDRCRTLWEDLHGLDRAIDLWKEQPVRSELTEKILAGLEEGKPIAENSSQETMRAKNRRRIWYSAATVIVALLLFVAISPQFRFENRNDGKIGPTNDIVLTEPSGDISGDLADVVSQFRKASLQFVVDAGNSASDATMLIPEREEWPVLGKTLVKLPAKENSVSSQLVEGFSPLGSRLDRAFRDLLESVDHETRTKPELE